MLVNYNKLAEYNQKKSLESSKLCENYKNNLENVVYDDYFEDKAEFRERTSFIRVC